MYKVHFTLKETEYELVAESLDLSHPYFVSIKDMHLDYGEGLVVNPHLENTKKRFEGISNIMIPFQTVALIESVPAQDKRQKTNKMQVVSLRENNSDAPGENAETDES